MTDRMTNSEEVTVRVFRDGTDFCALIGRNLMEGIAGFGSTRGEALKELAKELDAQSRDEQRNAA